VPPKKRLRLLAPSAVLELAAAAGGLVEHLAGLESIERWEQGEAPAGSAAIAFEGSELRLDGIVDAADLGEERKRLEKLVASLKGRISGFEAKLSNPGYLAKAKPELVEETRGLLDRSKSDLEAAERALGSLGG
jgi:valyl-tRNA synthetase